MTNGWRFQIRRDDSGLVIDFTSPTGDVETMSIRMARRMGRSGVSFLAPHDVVCEALAAARRADAWPRVDGTEDAIA